MRVLVLSDFTQKIDTTSYKLFKFEFNGVINPNEHSLWEDVSEFEIDNLQKNLPGLIDSGVRKLQNDFKIESGENHKNLAFIEHISLNWIAVLAAFIVQKKFEMDKLISLYQIDRILVDKPENFQFTSNMDLHSYLNHKDWNLWLTTLLLSVFSFTEAPIFFIIVLLKISSTSASVPTSFFFFFLPVGFMSTPP